MTITIPEDVYIFAFQTGKFFLTSGYNYDSADARLIRQSGKITLKTSQSLYIPIHEDWKNIVRHESLHPCLMIEDIQMEGKFYLVIRNFGPVLCHFEIGQSVAKCHLYEGWSQERINEFLNEKDRPAEIVSEY